MFKSKYRIVTDNYNGFECQKKRWWLPLWFEMGDAGISNTFSTIEEAKISIENDGKVVATFISDT